MVDLVAYDEFGLFADNAAEVGLPYNGPPLVRRVSVRVDGQRSLSALVWGDESPEFVFLHGGGQNAHTWDTVALALGRPLVAIDLPGHGHSDAGRNGSLGLESNAADIAVAIRALAPTAKVVVGMSLGGMTLLALCRHAPELVRLGVLVDVTPGVTGPKAKTITDFISGPESFADFDEILERTIRFNPTRSETSLRRGILHNAKQLPDGSWVWRYRRFLEPGHRADVTEYWDVVSSFAAPLVLVRGMRPQSVVDDADEAEFRRRASAGRVVHVEEAGHSVQGDTPLELAEILRRVADDGPGSIAE